MIHKIPPLKFEYNALEPFIDSRTMEIHHTKHHQAYVDKLNAALYDHDDLKKMSVEELLSTLGSLPDEIRTAVRNHGGGHLNHSIFWKLLKKGVKMPLSVQERLIEAFGSVDEFKKAFEDAAGLLFGSGWVWLALDGDSLGIVSLHNQDSPIMSGMTPVLGLDVWEHAYYLKYQNRRADYAKAFWNVVNWNTVEKNMGGVK